MIWRFLLNRVLHRAAEEAVSAAAAKAASAAGEPSASSAGATESRDADSAGPRTAHCDVGFVFATNIEQGGLEDLLHGVTVTRGAGFVARVGELQGRRLALVTCGVGRERAANGCQALIEGHRPSWIISAGFAGGLRPELRRGDFLMANHLVEPGGESMSIDVRLHAAPENRSTRVHIGRLLTVDRVARLPSEKTKLGQDYDATAVDMETWEVAAVCRQRKVRFLSVRIISDALNDVLPEEIDRLARADHAARRLGTAVGAIWRRPGAVKDMLKLREDALVASDRLAEFLKGIVAQLATEPNPQEPS